jgi:hypothetical protein
VGSFFVPSLTQLFEKNKLVKLFHAYLQVPVFDDEGRIEGLLHTQELVLDILRNWKIQLLNLLQLK